MYRILIVEDMALTRNQLKKLIEEEVPEAEITAVESVEEGMTELEAVLASGEAMQAAILDLKIPQRPGGSPELDETLFGEISQKMPETLLLTVSAHSDFMEVLRAQFCSSPNAPRALLTLFINKGDLDWPNQLVRTLKAHLYGQPIRRELQEVFGASKPTVPGASTRRGSPRRGGMTHKLESLVFAVREHWGDLDEELQKEIQEYFDVILVPADKPRVGLRGF